jgi:hypothetical protein
VRRDEAISVLADHAVLAYETGVDQHPEVMRDVRPGIWKRPASAPAERAVSREGRATGAAKDG